MIVPTALLTSCLLLQAMDAPVEVPPAQPPASTQPAAPTTRPTLEQERAEYRLSTEQELADLPKLPDTTIDKLLSIKLDQGHLHVKTLLPATDGMTKLSLTDWPGFGRLLIGPPESLLCNFVHTNLAWRDAVVVNTTVMTHPDYLQLNRDIAWNGDERMQSVTLIQSGQFADEDGNPIRLTIQYTELGNDGEEEKAPVNRNTVISAASFEQLRLAHPTEVRTYLLPILRDLGAAALVRSSDPRVAWQVLGDAVPADEKLQAKAVALLKEIEAGDFKARIEAEESLVGLGPEGAAVVSNMDLAKLSPDARAAADNLLNRWRSLTPAQVKQMAGDVNFLIDTAGLDDARIAGAAVAQLSKVIGKPVDLAPTLTAAQREEKLEAFRPALSTTTAPSTQPAP